MRKLLTLTLLLSALGSQAQVTSLVTAKINSVADLSVNSQTAAPTIDFEFNTASELVDGLEQFAFTLDAKANKGFFVSVQADNNYFQSATAANSLPVSALAVKIGNGLWINLADSAKEIIGSAVSGVSKGSYSYAVSYKLTPGLAADPASDYSTTLTYTLSAL